MPEKGNWDFWLLLTFDELMLIFSFARSRLKRGNFVVDSDPMSDCFDMNCFCNLPTVTDSCSTSDFAPEE